MKARLVAKRFQDHLRYSVDSPTVSKSTLKMSSLSTTFGCKCKTSDDDDDDDDDDYIELTQ